MQISANHIFIVGVKGAIMANIALFLTQTGYRVSGSDTDEAQITDAVLQQAKLTPISLDEALPTDVDLLIYSAAHGGTQSVQAKQAEARGIRILHHAELIQDILSQFPTSIAVCGCHGKTGTTSLLAYTLRRLGVPVSWLIGVSEFAGAGHMDYGGHYDGASKIFVFEADEYALNPPLDKRIKLLLYTPTHMLCVNIDFDHPDVYHDIDHTKSVFQTFFHTLDRYDGSGQKHLIACGDDENCRKVASSMDSDLVRLYGDDSSFPAPRGGEKNRLNAIGVATMLEVLGYEKDKIVSAMAGFSHVKRRMEHVASAHGIEFYDDYGHHPGEIEAILEALRAQYPDRRIVVLFQSHTYSRTHDLRFAFIQSLAVADLVFIDEVFPSAREAGSVEKITSADLEAIARTHGHTHIHGFATRQELINAVKDELKEGDVVLTLGAGDIYKIIPLLNQKT